MKGLEIMLKTMNFIVWDQEASSIFKWYSLTGEIYVLETVFPGRKKEEWVEKRGETGGRETSQETRHQFSSFRQ